jgi:hypothetical protein
MKSHATFDLESAKRIANATRTVEGMGKTLGGGTGYTPVLGGGGKRPTLGTLFAVVLVQSGGSNGTASAAPTYTYKINDINDEVELEGTPQAPELGRPNGAVTAATRGMAYYDVDGDITLFYAHELPSTTTCAT